MLESARKMVEQVHEKSMRNFDYTSDMHMEGLFEECVLVRHISERCWVEADTG